MSPDLLAAIVTLVNATMAADLRAVVGSPKAWPEYAPPVGYPYAIVTNPSESYEYQSRGDDGVIAMLVDGQMQVSFYATSMTEARRLGRTAILKLADQDITFSDGTLLEFRPMSASTTALYEEGVASPTVFVRTVTFHYREQYPQT
jgi:hypothetical protein